MTVTNGGIKNFFQDREKITRIAGSKFIFVYVGPEYNRLLLSLSDCVYGCERYEMVSKSTSNQEIHFQFYSIWPVQVYGRRK